MAALGAIAVDIDHPRSLISAVAPAHIFNIAVRLLFFVSIPAIISIASSRRVNLMDPNRLLKEDLFRLLVVVTIGAGGLLVLARLIHGLVEHRGPIHSPAIWVVVTIAMTIGLALFVPGWWWMGPLFGWGWFTHIAADSLTHQGIPFLWPISDEKTDFMPGCMLAPLRVSMLAISGLSMVLLVMRYLSVF
jgi:LexA-binding, inner membrane-associated putative hydrolase